MADINLTLLDYQFEADALDGFPILEMRGSNASIIVRLLGFLGMSKDDATLIISKQELRFRFSGLHGITYIVCPLESLTCSLCGLEKPLWALIGGVLAVLTALFVLISGRADMTMVIVALAIGAGLLYYYIQTKFVALTFSTGDMGETSGLSFRATTIKGKLIGVDQILEAIGFINQII